MKLSREQIQAIVDSITDREKKARDIRIENKLKPFIKSIEKEANRMMKEISRLSEGTLEYLRLKELKKEQIISNLICKKRHVLSEPHINIGEIRNKVILASIEAKSLSEILEIKFS